jgi:hypothetical protein
MRASGGFRLYSESSGFIGVELPTGASAWSTVSDSTKKMDRKPADGPYVLSELEHMPIDTWRYKHQPGGPLHMGPMAQDFYNSFGLGDSDTPSPLSTPTVCSSRRYRNWQEKSPRCGMRIENCAP